MIGSTVSHYKILEKLGEGGMGVVYKAHDTKLDRTVALKFLPHHLTANEAEQARFLQEARAAAALNHPNVCSVIDIQEFEKQQFIIMEFVDGTTLRNRIPIPKLADVLSYAIQIGEALQEAHAKGIVHRDIKADNIMVNSKNQVKVMDFGLAKLKGSLKLTRTSSTVGTLAYMSPEQIQGGEVDARSDIFSFGVVLFEMLTGRLPFRGEHEAAIMYSILNEEPDQIQSVRADLSAEFAHVINRALEKNPEDRYQHANDMTIDLRRLRKESTRVVRSSIRPAAAAEEVTVPPADREMPAAKASTGGRIRFLYIGGVAAMAIAATIWFVLKPQPKISDSMVFRPLQLPFSTIWYPGLSADGNWIAFPATDDNSVSEIYYMHASGGEPKKLTNDSLFKYTADISPDGSQIVYSAGTSRQILSGPFTMWTISTLGGSPRKIGAGVGGRWSPDGKLIAYMGFDADKTTLSIISSDGSDKRTLIKDSVIGRISLAWSPDGKSLAWLRGFRGPGGVHEEIIIHDIESGRERQVTNDKKNIDEVYWLSQGLILFSSNREGPSNLWAIPPDGGTPMQITKGPGPDIGMKASSDGRRVVYLQQSSYGSIVVADLDGTNGRPVTSGDEGVSSPRFSPDGKLIAFIVNDPDPITPARYIYVIDSDGHNRRQLTTKGETYEGLEWSPDSRRIAFSIHVSSEVDSTHPVNYIDVTDPSQGHVVGNGFAYGWTSDGSAILAIRKSSQWKLPIDGSPASQLFPDSTGVFEAPDGKKAVILDGTAARLGFWIRVTGKPDRQVYSGSPFGYVAWTPDSKAIVFLNRSELTQITAEEGNIQPYVWKNQDVFSFEQFSPDGKHTLFVKPKSNSKLILIDNFR